MILFGEDFGEEYQLLEGGDESRIFPGDGLFVLFDALGTDDGVEKDVCLLLE